MTSFYEMFIMFFLETTTHIYTNFFQDLGEKTCLFQSYCEEHCRVETADISAH